MVQSTTEPLQVIELGLDRSLQNHEFDSWKLLCSSAQLPLTRPCSPAVGPGTAVDYIRTRAALLHNHLHHSCGRVFVFTRPSTAADIDNDASELHELSQAGAHAALTVLDLKKLSGGRTSGDRVACLQAALQPSVAVAVEHEDAPSGSVQPLLFSRGAGDLCMLQPDRADGCHTSSREIYPLPYASLEKGCRPFVIEACLVHSETGLISCVIWAVRDSAAGAPACIESHLLILRAGPQGTALSREEGAAADVAGDGSPGLSLVSSVLIARSAMPPHLAIACPSHAAILLAVEPDLTGRLAGEDELQPESRPSAADEPSPAEGTTSGSEPVMGQVDARTFEQAVAALAKFTSEEPVGPLPHQQWSDLYSETGPDGVGAMGSEPSCDVLAVKASYGNNKLPCVAWRLTCGAHKLLSCSSNGGVLAVSDDVDCAVLHLRWPQESTSPEVIHTASVPALAYIAAGKLLKKYLLVPKSGGWLAAVLVENQKLMYVYTATASMQRQGKQQVIDMGLVPGETVLGARLLDGNASTYYLLLLTQRRLILHTLVPSVP